MRYYGCSRQCSKSGHRLSDACGTSFFAPIFRSASAGWPAGPRRSRLDPCAAVCAVARHLHLYCEPASSACSAASEEREQNVIQISPLPTFPTASLQADGLGILLAIKPWFSSPPRFLFHLYSVAFPAICHCCSLAAPLLSNLSLPSLLPSPPPLCRLTACLPT